MKDALIAPYMYQKLITYVKITYNRPIKYLQFVFVRQVI